MIDTALGLVLAELNTYLGASFGGHEKHAVLGSVAAPAAGGLDPTANRVVLSLVNLERETTVGSTGFVAGAAGSYVKTSPGLYLNLYLLVAANFPGNYDNALKMLGACMGFFQSRPMFDPQNSARFPSTLAPLTMELVSLDIGQLSALWTVLGNNYLPSCVYKLRMIALQNAWTIATVPTVQAPAVDMGN